MCNQKLLLPLLLLTVAAAASGAEAEPEDADAMTISPATPGAQEEARNMVKRAPTSSFIGMRGKKEQDPSADANWLGPDPLDYGEQDEENSYYENGRRLKKAPMAFVGMRGKKFSPNTNRLRDLLKNMEEQRLRESFLQEFLNNLATDDGDVAKRAPTGFTGMRGKRPSLSENEDDEDDALELLEKRAPVNSFVGMRGKKDVSHQHYKRAALSELWRQLSKKAYDVRGKKQRYADFNSKFVAVRGKKSALSDANGAAEENLIQPWVYVIDGKRAPSGFLGMRGKRPALVE